MSREIKFRAWNGFAMEYGGFSIHATGKVEPLTCITAVHRHSPIMQYTGIEDKNGKGIYEGDIIVYYLDDHNSNKECYRETVAWSVCGFRLTLPTSFYEVIGNIYQGSELLEDNNNEKL